MKLSKQMVVTLVTAFVLLVLIGGKFYRFLATGDHRNGPSVQAPQKAVMAQAEELNRARLNKLAERGQVTVGMTMSQVRTALGEPVRTMVDSSGMVVRTIWWYEHDGGRSVHFGQDGKVDRVEE